MHHSLLNAFLDTFDLIAKFTHSLYCSMFVRPLHPLFSCFVVQGAASPMLNDAVVLEYKQEDRAKDEK